MKTFNFFSFMHYWRESPGAYRKLLTGLLAFALINSSDVFLLLTMKNSGLGDIELISIYIFYNLTYAVTAFPIGILADKMGLWKTLTLGFCLFGVVYGTISFFNSVPFYLLLFFLYGLYAASTEGISKAMISNIAESKDTATAIGTFSAFNSIFAFFPALLPDSYGTIGGHTLFSFLRPSPV